MATPGNRATAGGNAVHLVPVDIPSQADAIRTLPSALGCVEGRNISSLRQAQGIVRDSSVHGQFFFRESTKWPTAEC
jgi:hypothetical protein